MSEAKAEGEFKIQPKKPKKKNLKVEPTKVVIGEPAEPTKVVIDTEPEKPIIEEVIEEVETEVEEIIELGEVKTDDPAPIVTPQPVNQLPENVEKLVSFLNDTPGSTIEDYVRLNADYSGISDDVLLTEYYKKEKPHLDADEIAFLIEDNFSYDEDVNLDSDIRAKKIKKKEEVAKARNFLEKTKNDYYAEIKSRLGVSADQQKANEFFQRYNQDQEVAIKQHEDFKATTNKYFTEDFKGFDFNFGDKKFRYGVQDPSKLAENQSDINNFVRKFLDDKGNVADAQGYHKALYMASNADTIANHFYEQGKSDATREIISTSKNPSGTVRQAAKTGDFINGVKAKVIGKPSHDSSKLKIKKVRI